MKHLLVPIFADKHDQVAMQAARAFIGGAGGHISARLMQRDPIDVIPYVGEGVGAVAIEKLLESSKAAAESRLNRSTSMFADWCESNGITVDDGNDAGTSADFEEIVGTIPYSLTIPGRTADAIVFANLADQENADWDVLLEAALFETGRPVLLAPAEPMQTIGRRILIAWNGSSEAARAVAVAMPALTAADAVFVVSVADSDTPPDPTKVTQTLRINGINASDHLIPCSDDGVTATLAAEAKKTDADLLVFGAYSHSRLREFVLGGATKDVMDGFKVPVLMTH